MGCFWSVVFRVGTGCGEVCGWLDLAWLGVGEAGSGRVRLGLAWGESSGGLVQAWLGLESVYAGPSFCALAPIPAHIHATDKAANIEGKVKKQSCDRSKALMRGQKFIRRKLGEPIPHVGDFVPWSVCGQSGSLVCQSRDLGQVCLIGGDQLRGRQPSQEHGQISLCAWILSFSPLSRASPGTSGEALA